MDEELRERLDTVERAVTDGDTDLSALADAGDVADRLAEAEGRLDDLADATAELEAATQAIRGYVGHVRSVNREVEATAERALARVEALETVDRGGGVESTGELADAGPETGAIAETPGAATESDTATAGRPPLSAARNGATEVRAGESGHAHGPDSRDCPTCGRTELVGESERSGSAIPAGSGEATGEFDTESGGVRGARGRSREGFRPADDRTSSARVASDGGADTTTAGLLQTVRDLL